jgi:hypothetical protein
MVDVLGRTAHWLAMALIAVVVMACSDEDSTPTDPTPSDDDQTITLTLNGGSLSNKVLSFTDSTAVSVYNANDDMTTIRFNGKVESKAISVVIAFKGTAKSTRQLDGTSLTEGIIVQWGADVYAAMTQGKIVITKYDDSNGGEVEGTFDGTAIGTLTGAPVTLTVSNGAFTAKRAS